jgi:hypothetical protein
MISSQRVALVFSTRKGRASASLRALGYMRFRPTIHPSTHQPQIPVRNGDRKIPISEIPNREIVIATAIAIAKIAIAKIRTGTRNSQGEYSEPIRKIAISNGDRKIAVTLVLVGPTCRTQNSRYVCEFCSRDLIHVI